MNNKGQAVFSEYVMIFFVVVAAAVAMTTFVQRGFEARVHDARKFMIDSASNALGSQIPYEYEPYYAQMLSDVGTNKQENTGATPSTVNWSIGAVYTKATNEATTTISTSKQLPPGCADGVNPKPSWCGG